MKKVFKTLSAILLASACLVPGLAWADSPSVSLQDSGTLEATDAKAVHSALVEVEFVGANADKVFDVGLKDVPGNALGSAVYDPATKKATIAVSSGDDVLFLSTSSLGTLDVIAQGASPESPVPVEARVVALEYIDSPDSSAPVANGDFSTAVAKLSSTESVSPYGRSGEGMDPGADGIGAGLDGVRGRSVDPDLVDTNTNVNPAAGANGTTTADYKANGVVSTTQAGQSTAAGSDTGLVKTGDVLLICGIAIIVAAAVVFIAMGFMRRKNSARR